MAKDIKINEVQTVNDASFITVILDNGSLGKIAKNDLFPLLFRDRGNLNGNANNIIDGIYSVNQDFYPSDNIPGKWGILISMSSSLGSNKAGFQLFFSTTSQLWFRHIWDTSWSSWKSVSIT
jgi:hypothetical protein